MTEEQPCVVDPSVTACKDEGFSFSIWEKHVFDIEVFQQTDEAAIPEADYKYVLSSGQ